MKIRRFFVRFLFMTIILLFFAFVSDISIINTDHGKNRDRTKIVLETNVANKANLKDDIKEEIPVFSKNKLVEENINRIKGLSWKPDAPVKLDELRYIKVTYWGFDDKNHIGELVVHEKVADEVVEIFKELYEAKFPIEKIKIIDEYNADDNLSMDDNNTSSFNYRVVAGTKTLSKHSYGLAIDINPVQNPYIKGQAIQPKKGKKYTDRSNIRKGMIVRGDVCYKAFVSRGWIWGGEWKTVKDYQHFQKDVNLRNN